MILSENPLMTILIVSHDKPSLLPEAVQSVLAQTFTAWQGILIDSGVLYERGFFERFPWAGDPRLRIVRSAETPALRRRKAMAPWCFNECLRQGWARGELVTYLCDDDILYPHAFATFVDAFQRNPDAMAMYASEDVACIAPDGRREIVGERRVLAPGGKCCHGRLMDCQVDYLQLCHRRSALRALPDGDYWPEDKSTEDHADGLFMEKLGNIFPILPIDVKIGQNRRTPWSINVPIGCSPGFMNGGDPPVHETIMDAWMALRTHLERDLQDTVLRKALAEFQGQLRRLCEQDQAQRRRLVSERYRLVDRLHAILAEVPGGVSFSKCCQRILANRPQR